MKINRIECKNESTVSYGFSFTVENHKGNVIIIPDIFDDAVNYHDFASFIASNGFNVYCLDLFGRGENVKEDGSNYGIVPESAFRKEVIQIDVLVKQLRLSAKPTFIIANGYGSVYAQDYIQRFTEHVSKVVLISCPLETISWFNLFQFAKLSKIFVNRRKPSKVAFSHFKKKYPDLEVNSPSVGYFYEFEKGLNRLYKKKFMSKIRKDLDIYLLSSWDDLLTKDGDKTQKIKSIYNKLKIENVHVDLFNTVNVSSLNNSDKTEVYNAILAFLLDDIESKNII
ncbi:MAG: alpha/beta hydrolase [Bacilli bacterium]